MTAVLEAPSGRRTGLAGRRVVVVGPGIPHESRGASIVLFFHYVRALCESGAEVLNVLLLDEGTADRATMEDYRRSMSRFGAVQVTAHGGRPVFPARRYGVADESHQFAALRRDIATFGPAAALCFDLAAASVVAPMPIPLKTVWLGDLAFDSHWYNYLYGFRERPATLRRLPYALLQRRAWRRLYRRHLAGFDPIIVSSKSSEAALARLGLRAAYRPYPWPNTGTAEAAGDGPDAARPTFAFFGNLVGLGSRSSFHFLFGRVYPHLLRRWGAGGFRILIAGREALPAWVGREIASRPEVEFLGFVDDLDRLLGRCHAVLAPLDVPVGNRSRILTAMAKRVLVIAHANAALGNPSLRDGDTCFLAATPEGFAERMRRAVDEPQTCRAIIDRAEAAYRAEFAPEAAAATFVDIIATLGDKVPRDDRRQ